MSGLQTKENTNAQIIENVLIGGDLSLLSNEQRVIYYNRTCESLGLNSLTKPFDYIRLNNKLVLYAKRDATDQLRSLRKVSVKIVSREKVGDVFTVTAQATTPDGRSDESIGAVSIGKLAGDALANALMKAETKAKRRVTLSICGLGLLDETEIESIPTVPHVDVPKVKLAEPAPQQVELAPDDEDHNPLICPECGAEGRASKYKEGEFYCSEYKQGCKAKWSA